jgi:large subunit ribosomal protein L13
VDAGDYVIVEHASKVKLSGNQWQDKTYFKHTGYAGSEKFIPISHFREKDPGEVGCIICFQSR